MANNKDIDALREKFQSGNYERFPLKNVILWYPHLATPDVTEWDKEGKYKTRAIVAEDVAEDMKAVGFNVKIDKDGQHFVDVKRKPSLGPPTVVMEDGTSVNAGSVGNGTIASLDVSTKYWNVGSKPSQALYLEKVTIHDLVEYTGGDAAADGFDPF